MKTFCTSLCVLGIVLISSTEIASAAAKFKIRYRLAEGISVVNCISATGVLFPGTVSNGKATVSIPASSVNGASCFALDSDGRLIGPVFAPKGGKGLLALVRSPKDSAGKKLKTLQLKLRSREAGNNFVMVKSLPKGKIFDPKYKYTTTNTPSLGLNLGTEASSLRNVVKAAAVYRADQDGDGVVDSLDADKDGDGVPNLADSSEESANGVLAEGDSDQDSEVALPFTTLYLDMRDTLNWRVNQSLTQEQIDAVIGGENKFSIAFFFGLATDRYPTLTGGHVICGNSLEYCRPTSVGASTAVYSGFSEGDSSLLGQLWSGIQTDGSPYSLEQLTIGGGDPGGITLAAAIQPRVGTDRFRPGDAYRVDFTNSTGGVVTSRPLILPPYFVSVPAMKSYNVTSNDSSADVVINYANTSGLGMAPGNPIPLATSGDFRGKLRMLFWRLQRLAVAPSESGSYRDFGHLNYGVTIDNNSGEFTCGGLYSNLSSTLSEVDSQGEGGSYQSNQGAVLWPLVDSADDFDPESTEPADVANELLSFTVDLGNCLTRNGLSAGTHRVNLFAAGIDTGHGANRAAQSFYVQIP